MENNLLILRAAVKSNCSGTTRGPQDSEGTTVLAAGEAEAREWEGQTLAEMSVPGVKVYLLLLMAHFP